MKGDLLLRFRRLERDYFEPTGLSFQRTGVSGGINQFVVIRPEQDRQKRRWIWVGPHFYRDPLARFTVEPDQGLTSIPPGAVQFIGRSQRNAHDLLLFMAILDLGYRIPCPPAQHFAG